MPRLYKHGLLLLCDTSMSCIGSISCRLLLLCDPMDPTWLARSLTCCSNLTSTWGPSVNNRSCYPPEDKAVFGLSGVSPIDPPPPQELRHSLITWSCLVSWSEREETRGLQEWIVGNCMTWANLGTSVHENRAGSSGVEGKDAGRRYQQPPEDWGSTNKEKKYVKSQNKKASEPTAVGWAPILFWKAVHLRWLD